MKNQSLFVQHWSTHSFLEAFIASLSALLIAWAIRYAFHNILQTYLPTLTFMLATFFIAWYYGYVWGIFVEITGFLTATFFFVEPFNHMAMPSTEDLYRMVYFFFITLLVILVFEKNQRDKHRAALLAEKADQQYIALVALDKELRHHDSGY